MNEFNKVDILKDSKIFSKRKEVSLDESTVPKNINYRSFILLYHVVESSFIDMDKFSNNANKKEKDKTGLFNINNYHITFIFS